MKLFLIGGFLGSGKTTAIQHAAIQLQKEGKRVGVITNDQGEQLVDTRFMQELNIPVEEVRDGCFCCHFHQLAESIDALRQMKAADTIFAESVGSCTDLVATVIKPLLEKDNSIDIVLSVFVDVRLLCAFLPKRNIFYGNINYIYQKQLEEADFIVVNKMDMLDEEQEREAREIINREFPSKKILYQSSLNPQDIQHWLAEGYSFAEQGLRRSLDMNYDDYADGEAEMAWYDSELEIITSDGSAAEIAFEMIHDIYQNIKEEHCIIGHLKFLLVSNKQQIKISFTNMPPSEYIGLASVKDSNRVSVLINGRVKTSPERMEKMISDIIHETQAIIDGSITEKNRRSFQPGYPMPTYRMGN